MKARMLGVLREGDGIASRVLEALGVQVNALFAAGVLRCTWAGFIPRVADGCDEMSALM